MSRCMFPHHSVVRREANSSRRRGRPHYYSYKKEEYAHINFDLDAGTSDPLPCALSRGWLGDADIQTDLSTLFNWNTKQVFLYIKAVYPSTKKGEPASEAIIWDAILPSASAPWHQNHYIHPIPKDQKSKSNKSKKSKQEQSQDSPYGRGILKLDNQRPKYQITDITGKLQNRTDVVLELGWNVQPWVGALLWENKKDFGVWKGVEGGVSDEFGFPEIGAKKVDLKTEKGQEGYRLNVGGEQPVKKSG